MFFPRVGELGGFSEASDVYSFGVFLLEFISGMEVAHCFSLDSHSFLAQWVILYTHLTSSFRSCSFSIVV